MKKVKRISAIGLMLSLLLASCGPTEEKHFNTKYLIGEWIEEDIHDKYAEDGTGYTWNPSEDIQETEAAPFEWRLSYDTLLVNHIEWNGAIGPKVYIVTQLDSARLDYYDLFSGLPHHYTKVIVP